MTEPPKSDATTPQSKHRLAGRTRLAAAGLFAVATTVLAVSLWLRPDPRGYGTHQQLRMNPCGMLVLTGLPCPTCGMTTAFAYAVRGQWLRAFWAQPSGFFLALATAAGAAYGFHAMVIGHWPYWPFPEMTPYRFFWLSLLLLVGGWGFKLAAGLATREFPASTFP